MAHWNEENIEKALEIIFERIEEGESVRSILGSDRDKKLLPSRKEFNEWLIGSEEIRNQYARATELRADKIFEEILNIADTPQEGITIKETDRGQELTKGDMIQHRRLQVDARKWMLSKMNPKKYGDKTDLTTNGENITHAPVIKVYNTGPKLASSEDEIED